MDDYRTTITNCQRCGGTHSVIVKPFRERAGRHTHWAMCPENVEPILILQMDGEVADMAALLLESIRKAEDELMAMVGVHSPPAPSTREVRPEAIRPTGAA